MKLFLTPIKSITIDDDDFLNEDIYQYIHEHVFNNKDHEDISIKDIIMFFDKPENISKAKKFLALNMQELIAFIIKYFNNHTDARYQPLALAKKIKASLAAYYD